MALNCGSLSPLPDLALHIVRLASIQLLSSMPPNTLTLKQRLAALSLAPSSPTPPLGSDSHSLISRRKFNPPWKRAPGATGDEPGARDKVQEVMGKVIFQAGVDFE